MNILYFRFPSSCLKPSSQKLFDDLVPMDVWVNYLHFQLLSNSAAPLAACVKRAGKEFIGGQGELYLLDEQSGEETSYEMLFTDAMTGNGSCFTHEDAVKPAWTGIDPVLDMHHQVHFYKNVGWRPEQDDALIVRDGSWHNSRFSDATAY